MRSPILQTIACAALAAAFAFHPVRAQQSQDPPERFSVVEATIPELIAAMESGRATSREIVEQYLRRIGIYEDVLNAAIYVKDGRIAATEAAQGAWVTRLGIALAVLMVTVWVARFLGAFGGPVPV